MIGAPTSFAASRRQTGTSNVREIRGDDPARQELHHPTFLRCLAAENSPRGVRVVGIYTAGVVETSTRERISDVDNDGPDPQDVVRMIAGMAMLRCALRLREICATGLSLASDGAWGMTATTVNVTCGLVAGP